MKVSYFLHYTIFIASRTKKAKYSTQNAFVQEKKVSSASRKFDYHRKKGNN